MLIQLTVAGVAQGMVLSLLAVTFVLVYKATRVFNLAQGALVLLGTYLSYGMLVQLHLPLFAVVPLVIVLSAAIGYGIERLFFDRMITRDGTTLVIFTLMLNFLLVAVVGMIWGAAEKGFPRILPYGYVDLWGARVATVDLWISGSALVVLLLFFYVYERTPLGLAMRSAAASPEGATLAGINVRRSFAWSWAMAGGIGAVAGIFLAAMVTLNLSLWEFALMAFPAAVMGGMDSIGGALVGGLTMGLLQSLAGGYLDPRLGGGVKDSVAYLALLLILLVKPRGFFGTREIERL